jgi:hypothetical protein
MQSPPTKRSDEAASTARSGSLLISCDIAFERARRLRQRELPADGLVRAAARNQRSISSCSLAGGGNWPAFPVSTGGHPAGAGEVGRSAPATQLRCICRCAARGRPGGKEALTPPYTEIPAEIGPLDPRISAGFSDALCLCEKRMSCVYPSSMTAATNSAKRWRRSRGSAAWWRPETQA